jgi:hypothetical protein
MHNEWQNGTIQQRQQLFNGDSCCGEQYACLSQNELPCANSAELQFVISNYLLSASKLSHRTALNKDWDDSDRERRSRATVIHMNLLGARPTSLNHLPMIPAVNFDGVR